MAGNSELSILVKLVDQASAGLKTVSGSVKELGQEADAASGSTKNLESASVGADMSLAGMARAATAAVAAIASIAGSVKGLSDTVIKFAQLGENLENISLATGMGVETISVWQFAFKQAGGSAETFEAAYRGLMVQLASAESGNAVAQKSFRDLGLSWLELSRMSPEQQFQTVMNALAAMPAGTERAQLAMEVFGNRIGMNVIPALVMSYQEWEAQAKKSGNFVSQATFDAAKSTDESLDKMNAAWSGMSTSAGFALSETGKAVAGFVTFALEYLQNFAAWISNQDNIWSKFSPAGEASAFGDTAAYMKSEGNPYTSVVNNNVTVNVEGNVQTEQDLAEAIRESLIQNAKRNDGTGIY